MGALTDRERAFLERCCIGHLATTDRGNVPHLVPVCFALAEDTLYSPVDDKPKRDRALKRLRNIGENPQVCFLADRYDDDWSKLGWLKLEGLAEVLVAGQEFESAAARLRKRYPQYEAMSLNPVMAMRILRVRAWGNLDG
jgi:PPOX class probable F420-dependent enzyme